MSTLKVGKKTYQVITKENTVDKYPAINARGWVAIYAAVMGETVFQIFENKAGNFKVIRAFV